MFLIRTRCFTQPNSLTVPRLSGSLSVMAQLFSHLHMSPVPRFLWYCRAIYHSPSWGTSPALCLPLRLYALSDFKHPDLSWRDWLLCPGRGESFEGRIPDLVLLKNSYSTRNPDRNHCSIAPGAEPDDFPVCLPNFLTICFLMSTAIIDFQTSHKLGSHLLFALFFRRSAGVPVGCRSK